MGRYLMLDIGAGTMDILCYDSDQNMHYKAVVCSPTREIAKKIYLTNKNILTTGCEMGGGAISKALKLKAKNNFVVMTNASAATIHHNTEKVKTFNIKIIDQEEILLYENKSDFQTFELADIQIDRIKKIINSFGIKFKFDVVAICAQDHGKPPKFVSHLDFRHKQFQLALNQNISLAALLYNSDNIPDSMTRLKSIVKCTAKLPTEKVYVMDSGMAAILGASMDLLAQSKKRIIILDIATSHTVGAAIKDGILTSFFEYHTKDINLKKLEKLLKKLPEGKISYSQILKEGGHGSYTRSCFKYDTVESIIVTGPMRHIMSKCTIPIITFGSPWGDNMMTGTTGLMEAVRIQEGLMPIMYL